MDSFESTIAEFLKPYMATSAESNLLLKDSFWSGKLWEIRLAHLKVTR